MLQAEWVSRCMEEGRRKKGANRHPPKLRIQIDKGFKYKMGKWLIDISRITSDQVHTI